MDSVDSCDDRIDDLPGDYLADGSPDYPFKPINIKPDYMEDWAEREAILVIDGGVDPDVAGLQAAVEILERHGQMCLIQDAD